MNEIERIKHEGWLRPDFFEGEILCGHYVTPEMKAIWAIMLDLYREFTRVCEANNLFFFAAYGTALGAVRHNGFIPWDDDLDVMMPRSDYNRLAKLASEFKHPYFLQNVETDPEYGYAIQRLRNSNTTLIVEPFKYCKFNHGIFIDINVLDEVEPSEYVNRRNTIKEFIMQGSARMRKDHPHKDAHSIEVMQKYLDDSKSAADIYNSIHALSCRLEGQHTGYISNINVPVYAPERNIFPSNIVDDYAILKFEGTDMRVPIGYMTYLEILYGKNYMEMPSDEIKKSAHTLDAYPEIPYKKYYKEVLNIDL